MDASADSSGPSEPTDQIAAVVGVAVAERSWVEPLARLGWVAKSVVYTLMGLTTVQIASRDRPSSEPIGQASPRGSIAQVAAAPLGRISIAVLTVGLLLYVVWRLLSVALIRGHAISAWADRVGYLFSAIFYFTLALGSGAAAAGGYEPDDTSTVEQASTAILDVTAGRWLLGAAGLVTIGVGLYFAIGKGLRRSFVSQLAGVDADAETDTEANDRRRTALVISGVVGWVGRGTVTVLVGYFVLRSAYRFDSDEALGFDRALRRVAESTVGSVLVFACAIGLIAYGVFCFFSHRYRVLDHDTSDEVTA